MKIDRDEITLEYVDQEFREVGETIETLSLLRLQLINDCHFDSYDLTVEIYGEGIPDEVGPVVEIVVDIDGLLTDQGLIQGIDKKLIPNLFSQNLLNELIQRDTRIEFNRDDETAEVLYLRDLGEGYLLPMIR